MHDQEIHAEVNLKHARTHIVLYVCVCVCVCVCMYVYVYIQSVFTYVYAYTICAFIYSLPYLYNISSKKCVKAFKVTDESVYSPIHQTQAQVSADGNGQVVE